MGAHNTQRYRRSLPEEAVRCRQISSRCFQGYTTKLADTARPRLPKSVRGRYGVRRALSVLYMQIRIDTILVFA